MTKWHLSLKTAFALAFLAVAAIPVWLAWAWPQQVAIDHELKAAKQTHVVYTKAIALALEQYHTTVVTAFGILADDLQARENGPAIDRTKVLKAYRFNRICNFDAAKGTLIGSMIQAGRPCPAAPPAEKMTFIRSVAAENQIRFSDVMIGPSGQPILLMVRRNGPVIVVGVLNADYFRTVGETIKFGRDGHAVIVDHTGQVLHHPNADWENPPKKLTTLKPFKPIMDEVLAGNSGTGEFFSPAKNTMMETAYRSVKGPGWGILVNQPTTEMETAVAEIRNGTFGVLALALGIATALAMLAAHVLLDPIKRIRAAAERLGSGDGDALIAPTGAGQRLTEINDLRAAFNAMVLRIRRSHRTEIAARKEAQEATRIKSRFLANMSHELRTPLNAIIGFAEVTQRRLASPGQERDREYVGYIHDSGHHLLSIINDLLDLSRIEAGARELDEEDVDLGAAIRETVTMLGTMHRDKNIEVVLKGTDEVTMLWADRRAVKQMLLNLATNAVRYTQEGGRVILGCARGEGGAVSLTVEDNGPGIDPDELEKIRSPFARGRAHETAAVPGTGLGLSIVDALSDLHGARFDLTSEPGIGTRAKIVFPPNRALLVLDAVEDAKRVVSAAE